MLSRIVHCLFKPRIAQCLYLKKSFTIFIHDLLFLDLRVIPTSASTFGLDVVNRDRELTEALAAHVIYDAANTTSLMSTQLLALLLLYRHRKGATLYQVAQSLSWLRAECQKRGRDVGFSGDSSEVVRYAAALLGNNIVHVERLQMAWSTSNIAHVDRADTVASVTILRPAVRLPAVLDLRYYANSAMSVFLLDSVVGRCLSFLSICLPIERYRYRV